MNGQVQHANQADPVSACGKHISPCWERGSRGGTAGRYLEQILIEGVNASANAAIHTHPGQGVHIQCIAQQPSSSAPQSCNCRMNSLLELVPY